MKRLSFLLVTLVACGGTPENVNQPAATPGNPATPTKPTASGDVSFELPVVEIKGVVYEPEGLEVPGMPLVNAKRAIPLDKQRALVASTKDPVVKQAQAAVLTTMLYLESKNAKDKEKDKWNEARQLLRDIWQQVGDKAVDEITAHLLGCLEIRLGDWAGAEKAWAKLVELTPKDKEAPSYRAWLAYTQLKQFKTAEAMASIGTDKLDEKELELAYFTAWAKWRAGDGAGAWQAINVAAKGWGQNLKRESLERDVLLIAARSPTTVDQAAATVTSVMTKSKQQQYELLAKLGLSGYGVSGRWTDGITALDKAVALATDAVPLADMPVIRYQQADFTVRLDDPDSAAKYAKQAVEALGKCGDKCTPRDRADTLLGIYLMGRLFHNLYATANDKRFYQATHDLYDLTAPLLDTANQTQAKRDIKTLETTLKNIKPSAGTHDRGAIGALLGRHNEEVRTCYEAALGSNPKLGGTITLTLESDATGVIKGAASEPAPGAAGLAAIAGCVVDHAKQWKLPKRGMAGNTRIKSSYTFSVKK